MREVSLYKVRVTQKPQNRRRHRKVLILGHLDNKSARETGFVVGYRYSHAVRLFQELSGLEPASFLILRKEELNDQTSLLNYERFLCSGFRHIKGIENYHLLLGRHALSRLFISRIVAELIMSSNNYSSKI